MDPESIGAHQHQRSPSPAPLGFSPLVSGGSVTTGTMRRDVRWCLCASPRGSAGFGNALFPSSPPSSGFIFALRWKLDFL